MAPKTSKLPKLSMTLAHVNEAKFVVDTQTLTEIVNLCFHASMDGRFTPAQRGQFLAAGSALREQLRRLVGKVFEAQTPTLRAANKAIADVNAEIKEAIDELDEIAETIELLGALVARLNSLVTLIGGVL